MALTSRNHSIGASTLLLLFAPFVSAQIFTCIDGYGRKITSDRPVAECRDKDQKELNPSGTIKRVVKPTMTAQEQQEVDDKLKAQTLEKAQIEEERRRNRAMLSRYPHQAAHDKERGNSLAQVVEVIRTAQSRIAELAGQRKKLVDELEFYKKDPTKAPAALRYQIDENEKSAQSQSRIVSEQNEEKKRIAARFDQELASLRKLWAQAAAPTSAALTATATASAPVKK